MRAGWLAAVVASWALAEGPASARPVAEWTLGPKTQVLGLFAFGHQSMPALSLGFDARLELSRLSLDATAGLILPASPALEPGRELSPRALFAHASASVLVNPDDVATCYLGAGIEPRLLLPSLTVALVPSAEVGVLLWRHGSTRLGLELRVGQNLLPVFVLTQLRRDGVYPTEVALGVAVGW